MSRRCRGAISTHGDDRSVFNTLYARREDMAVSFIAAACESDDYLNEGIARTSILSSPIGAPAPTCRCMVIRAGDGRSRPTPARSETASWLSALVRPTRFKNIGLYDTPFSPSVRCSPTQPARLRIRRDDRRTRFHQCGVHPLARCGVSAPFSRNSFMWQVPADGTGTIDDLWPVSAAINLPLAEQCARQHRHHRNRFGTPWV